MTGKEWKQCPNGHYYDVDECPYCKPLKKDEDYGPYQPPFRCDECRAFSVEYNGGKCPYCGKRMRGQAEDIYPWWLLPEHSAELIPICKHCGHRIRRNAPTIPGYIKCIKDQSKDTAPWNHGWDGKCEFCGYDYTIRMGIQIDDDGQKTDKRTSVSADCMAFDFPGCCDIYTILSGVTIRSYVGGKVRGEVFLSADELKCLIDSLKDSPLLEQYDFKFDSEL